LPDVSHSRSKDVNPGKQAGLRVHGSDANLSGEVVGGDYSLTDISFNKGANLDMTRLWSPGYCPGCRNGTAAAVMMYSTAGHSKTAEPKASSAYSFNLYFPAPALRMPNAASNPSS
jgi:hypothetical protein